MAEHRIYCAGPLFNPSGRAEMEILAEALELAGFKTFLPHRDGFLYEAIVPDLVRVGYSLDVAQWMARQAIFALDVYQVLVRCDGTVVNLNGRVPDEGAVVEGAMAWTARGRLWCCSRMMHARKSRGSTIPSSPAWEDFVS
jgi:nucleoside 2-deoxyribosyltransferase